MLSCALVSTPAASSRLIISMAETCGPLSTARAPRHAPPAPPPAALTAAARALARAAATLTAWRRELRLEPACARVPPELRPRRAPQSASARRVPPAPPPRSAAARIADRDVQRRPSVHIPHMRIAAALHQQLGDAVVAVVERDHDRA